MYISDFFIFGKLTELHCFVTYLSNDPHILVYQLFTYSYFVMAKSVLLTLSHFMISLFLFKIETATFHEKLLCRFSCNYKFLPNILPNCIS